MSSFRSPCALICQPLKHFGNLFAGNGCTLVQDNVGVIESRRQLPLQIFNHYTSTMSSRGPWLARQCAEAELAHAYPLSFITELALVWASMDRVFGQQRASCSVRHSKVVHALHRYAISSQGESPFSQRAVQFIQKANENAKPRSARGPEHSPRQVRELISPTVICTADLLSILSLLPPSRTSSRPWTPNPASTQKSLPITRTSSPSPPWQAWTFDQDILRTVKEWNEAHPENTLNRILNGTCAVIDWHNVLLDMIPNGPIPICGFVKALVHLVKLGAVGHLFRHYWCILILKWHSLCRQSSRRRLQRVDLCVRSSSGLKDWQVLLEIVRADERFHRHGIVWLKSGM